MNTAISHTEALESPVPAPVLMGRRLYSPGTLAAFTAICSLPIGFVLYGLNVKARGRTGLGRAMVAFGVLLQVLVFLLASGDALPRGTLVACGLFGALNVYKLETRPYALAIANGAVKARWWPAALVLFVLSILSLAAEVLL